ncbi:MAG: SAM-dependent methyltransferase [Verrucomicrobiales bacterium]|nr:SAM-dependent methyltransferase [Verrucomicrobiales bacterium]
MNEATPTPASPRPEPRRQFLDRAQESLMADTLVRLVLSSPRDGAGAARRETARVVELRGVRVLSVVTHEERRDLTRNLAPAEVLPWLETALESRFASALLETTRGDWQWQGAGGRRGAERLLRHRARTREIPARNHDRDKATALEPSAADWLKGLGLVDDAGTPLPSRRHKHQQLLRFAEILGHQLDDAGFAATEELHAVDMGCGRGALTFAAWQVLRRQRGLKVEMVGVEAQPGLARTAQELATRLGCDGLRFEAGTIAEVALPRIDLLLALHACDTATDEALLRGIHAGARVIVVAPCCHQQLRPQLRADGALGTLFRHGLLATRFADWLTDGLRALHLEWAGYRVRAIEFVDPEHTPKNLLLAAVRDPSRRPFADDAVRQSLNALREQFGVGNHAMDCLLTR